MAGIDIPDGGLHHPEAAAGAAFNGAVGTGIAHLLLRIIAAQPGVRTVCDLGCGNGYLDAQLGSRGYRVLGIDAADTYLDIARRFNGSERVTFEKGLIAPELADRVLSAHGPFDLVVSSDVIEHLYDPLEMLHTVAALLRPGGTAVIGTPYHGYLKNIAISVLGKWDEHHSVHWHGGHIKYFSVASLRKMLLRAGFTEPRFEYFGRVPGFWKNMIAVTTMPEAAARR